MPVLNASTRFYARSPVIVCTPTRTFLNTHTPHAHGRLRMHMDTLARDENVPEPMLGASTEIYAQPPVVAYAPS